MARRGLGRGLDVLIPAGDEIPQGIREVPLVAITPNPHQPRQSFPDSDLDELAESIQEHGVLQPLIVVQQLDGTYRLIAGERRWRAAKKAGLETIPVILKDAAPQEMLELALVENIQRADLNPLEQASAYQQLADTYHLSKSDIAR
ncbi:MAG: ParB/RepB/Spo0J family partition protein, partial [Anaerolineae bacterium]|nr:ParB/RepB/Spo0J family partition protein [Anaerolineae bacterium]